MIIIDNKKECTGCGACVNACPFNIISLSEDEEGFWYPEVEKDKCVDCHLCEKACPMLKVSSRLADIDGQVYPKYFSGQLKSKEILSEVSSGGAFWAFAVAVIEAGGVVYGAVQNDVDTIIHVRADTIEEIKPMRRSKYFQSDTGWTFRKVREDLKTGIPVLYSGTGCQIAGLIGYLGMHPENLFTCDVVCHGVPSRRVWRQYRKEKEERTGKKIVGLVFRDKSLGWSRNQYKITFDDGTVEKEASTIQLFHAGYLRGLFYRPSCGSCRFASLPRISDVTLADYWKYKGRFRQLGFDLGVSLITVNTVRGERLLKMSAVYLDYDTTYETLALDSCRHLGSHPYENPYRSAFFKLFSEKGYFAAADKYIVNEHDSSFIKKLLRKLLKSIRRYNK